MLKFNKNKIKIVGEVFSPIKTKKYSTEINNWKIVTYFSIRVIVPNNSLSILRCFARGEMAEKLEQEVKSGDILEIKGYLRNEKKNRQILVMVGNFDKLSIQPTEINPETSNQVQLVGKITDLQTYQNQNDSSPLASFKILVPWERSEFPLYFCRAQDQLATDIQNQLKEDDIILLEGYLQTVKVDSEISGVFEENESRISSIITQGFTLLGSDLADDFGFAIILEKLDNLKRVVRPVKKIDFSKEAPRKAKREAEE